MDWWTGEGALAASAQTGWSKTLGGGVDTEAHGGAVLLSNGAEALTGIPPVAWIPAVDSSYAGIWQSPWLTSARRVRGSPRLHLTVTPGSSGQTTVIAYLYDTDWAGWGRLVTHVAYTLRGVVAGQPQELRAPRPRCSVPRRSGERLFHRGVPSTGRSRRASTRR